MRPELLADQAASRPETLPEVSAAVREELRKVTRSELAADIAASQRPYEIGVDH